MAKFSWNEENTQQLVDAVGVDKDETVTQEQLTELSEVLGTTARSVGSKLRKMDYSVQKASEVRTSSWTDEQESELVSFIEANSGNYTYAEVAAAFRNGEFNPKQIQGKILSLEMTSHIKPTERVAPPRKYTDEQEARFVEMANSDATLEQIADELGVSLNSARGKALSLSKTKGIKMPEQAKSNAQAKTDVLEGLEVENMTVDQLVEATERTARGIRSMLSRRGIACADYDGAAKRAKIDASKAE